MFAPFENPFRNPHLENALKVTLSAVLPVLVSIQLQAFEAGFAIALGAFLTFPSDIPSTLSHKIKGVLFAAVLVSASTLLLHLLMPVPWLLYAVTAVLFFFLSMISVYGLRANMISFSGLLAVCLAFAPLNAHENPFIQALLMLIGGLFYLLISIGFHFFRPHKYSEFQIAECLKLTAKYLKLRGDLWNAGADREKIIEKQLKLQVELNTIHENLREVILRNRLGSGNSEKNRKLLIVFISLLEVVELGLATSFDHSKLRIAFAGQEKPLKTYQELAYALSSALKKLSKSIVFGKPHLPSDKLLNQLSNFENAIREFESAQNDPEKTYMLTNMLHYGEKQLEKIRIIQRAFAGKSPDLKWLKARDRDLEKFLTPAYYPIQTLIDNLGFQSTIFRHSLRLTLTIALAILLSTLFQLENSYWIFLTIVVIMRPGYGLTKERSTQRVVGTVAGGLIAFGLLIFIDNRYVLGAMTIVSMILGFMFSSTNYKVGVLFVTMYVVFLYGMLSTDVASVIELRVIDTLIGAGLAFLANYFLWPSWEFVQVPVHLKKSIASNRQYLEEISAYYNKKGDVTTNYRLARKNAFIDTGNLMASFQRMSQEPKSKQKNLSTIYKLAVLNHTLLSASASLGTYIQSHKTTSASGSFNQVVDAVIQNLDQAIRLLNLEDQIQAATDDSHDNALRFTELKNRRFQELQTREEYQTDEYQLKMQEAQLVIEQLVNLTSLSKSILKTTRKLLTD